MLPNKSPEPTAVGAAVPLSRFTPRVGGGSAFFVRPHSRMTKRARILVVVILGLLLVAFVGFVALLFERVYFSRHPLRE